MSNNTYSSNAQYQDKVTVDFTGYAKSSLKDEADSRGSFSIFISAFQ